MRCYFDCLNSTQSKGKQWKAKNTGCPKSSFLYFTSLYFSTIALGKQIFSTEVVSFNVIHYFHSCCAIFWLKYSICVLPCQRCTCASIFSGHIFFVFLFAFIVQQPSWIDVMHFCHQSEALHVKSTINHAKQRSLLRAAMTNNSAKNISELTFHKFPKDEFLWKQWVIKIRQDVGKRFRVSTLVSFIDVIVRTCKLIYNYYLVQF